MGLYISILVFFAGVAPVGSGWSSDRIGRIPLMIAGCALSAAFTAMLPYLSPGVPLMVGCAAVGTVLWALRPIIYATAMELTPPQLSGSLVGFLSTGNMGLSFIAPILTGLVADAYGLATALVFVGIFPLLASLFALATLSRARATR